MVNYEVNEGNGTVYEELESNPDIVVGDTIEYITNNQEGYQKFEVVMKDGEKGLNLIDDYDMQMERAMKSNNDGGEVELTEFDDEELTGGKRSKRKTSKKTKTYKKTKT